MEGQIVTLTKRLANCKAARMDAESKLKDWKKIAQGEATRHAIKLSEDLGEAISAQSEAERKHGLLKERIRVISNEIDDVVPADTGEDLEDKVRKVLAHHHEDQHSIFLLKEQIARRG